MKIIFLYTLASVALLISFFVNKQKTYRALKIAGKKFVSILPTFLVMLIFVSITLFIFPGKSLSYYLGNDNHVYGVVLAVLIGSITFVPGFIAFPLCGILLKQGVPYTVLSAFTTTLMMVGVVTFPIEKAYFGTKVTVIRNVISFFIALLVAGVTGIVFGEIF